MTTTNSDARKALRDKIFTSGKAKRKKIDFFGAEVELVQPSTGKVLELRSLNAEDPKSAAMEMIINYVVIPGTNEAVFEEADIESLLALPFGEDMARMNNAIAELTNIDVEGLRKNSETDLTNTTSTSSRSN